MEQAFEHVLTRDLDGTEFRFTATAELVARETGIQAPTAADIRRWLDDNADRATHAAFMYRIKRPIRSPDDDGIVRLGLYDFP